MSIKVMSMVWAAHPENLCGIEKSILLRMADFAADDGSSVYPGISRLERDTGFSETTIKKFIKILIEKKILIKIKEHNSETHSPNVYRIDVDVLQNLKNHGANDSEINPPQSCGDGGVGRVATHPGARADGGGGAPGDPNPSVKTIINPSLNPSCRVRPKKPVDEIFEYWQKTRNHPKSKLDDKRKKYILKAFQLGYSPTELMKAVDGVNATPHNRGENERGEVYDDFHVIFRDSAQIERFIRNAESPPTPLLKKNVSQSFKAQDASLRKNALAVAKKGMIDLKK